SLVFPGASLLALASETLHDGRSVADAKRLLRAALDQCLDGRALATRDVLRAMRAHVHGAGDGWGVGMHAIRLGVNIDHVATLRQVRRATYPDPLLAALIAEQSGADSITLHLREDRRHIQDHDARRMRVALQTRMNLELAATDAMVVLAREIGPPDCCLVPARRGGGTPEGGLDVAGQLPRLTQVCRTLAGGGIRVSLFIDPELRQIEASRA